MEELEDLLVRDGDVVSGSGVVVVGPDGAARFLAPGAVPLAFLGRPPSREDADLEVVGVDADRLDGVRTRDGFRWGRATVTGRLSGRTLTVESQGPPTAGGLPTTLPERPPCPPPAGGWVEGEPSPAELSALAEFLEAHPTEFGGLAITYPGGWQTGPRSLDAPGPTQVILVSTVLDVPAAEERLRTVFGGNLCVQPTARSRAEVDAVWPQVGGSPAAEPRMRRHGVFLGAPDYLTGRVLLALLMVDADALAWLREADPDGVVAAHPVLRPV